MRTKRTINVGDEVTFFTSIYIKRTGRVARINKNDYFVVYKTEKQSRVIKLSSERLKKEQKNEGNNRTRITNNKKPKENVYSTNGSWVVLQMLGDKNKTRKY